MSIIGKVDSLWRYPVKSMRGEELDKAFVGFSGIYGDRIFAFRSSASPKGFPYLTAREQRKLLRYRPRFRSTSRPDPWPGGPIAGKAEASFGTSLCSSNRVRLWRNNAVEARCNSNGVRIFKFECAVPPIHCRADGFPIKHVCGRCHSIVVARIPQKLQPNAAI